MAYVHCVSGGASKPELLWTNPSPSSNFANQTISIDLSGYDAVLISVKHATGQSADTSYDNYHCVCYTPVGTTGAYLSAPTQSNSRSYNVTTTGVQFVTASNVSASIPCKIWGLKGVTIS